MPEDTIRLLYFFFVAATLVFAVGAWMRIEAYRRGLKEPVLNHLGTRLGSFLRNAVFQAKTARKRYAGPMHVLIFYGFVALFIGTVLVLVEYDFTLPVFDYQFLVGHTYLVYEFVLDLFGLLFLLGLAMAISRRVGRRPEALYNKTQDVWILGGLLLLGIQGFVVESLRLSIRDPPWGVWSFAAYALSFLWQPLSDGVQLSVYRLWWWFHAITFFAWYATIPFTKMQHLFTSPASIAVSSQHTTMHPGELSKPFDLQKALETGDLDIRMGAQKLEDFTWRHLLNLDACTECGRCQEVCPAYAAGRPLSPMKVVLDLRDEMHRQTSRRWGGMMASANRIPRDQLEPDAAAPTPAPAGNQLVESVIRSQTLWSCVTCRACMEACPVMIEHVPIIVDLRRGLVAESRIDANMTRLLNNLANTGNAYGFPASDRDAWAGPEVPRIQDVDASQIEVLYWVGCSGSYDARNQKVSRALVKVLQVANVSFAILGKEERCNGDPARRLGEESRYQELVLQNAETLRKHNVRKVIAQCPHCFNTLRNEYRRFGVELEVYHHTQFVQGLIDAGRLRVAKKIEGATTYHDPCYLGRYNGEFRAPRQVLIQLQKGPVTEMPRSHEHSFCCGAGGSNMWFEVKEERERMSHIRIKEARATGAKRLATACPFCMTMFDDARGATGDDGFEVKDFVELVAESLA
jgi:Fe-S oxidoreductase/nitrate reductase gamma subunit